MSSTAEEMAWDIGLESIEVRETRDGSQLLECDWGVIRYPHPRPDRGQVGPLILAVHPYIDVLARQPMSCGRGTIRVTVNDDGQMLLHLDYGAQHWTWELFEAHWGFGDRATPPLMIGRWPECEKDFTDR